MVEVIHWLTDHETAVTAFGSLVGAASTLAIAFLTVFLWLENRALRKAGSEPKVVAHFEVHPNGSGAINISLSNVGSGPALDVSFSFIANPDDFSKYEIILDHSESRPAMTLIPSGKNFSFLFAVGFRLVRPSGSKDKNEMDPLKPFKIKVEWKNLHGKRYTQTYPMDIMQFNGLPGIFEKPPLLKAVDSLDAIGKQIGGLRYQVQELRSIVDTTTITESVQQKTVGNPTRRDDFED